MNIRLFGVNLLFLKKVIFLFIEKIFYKWLIFIVFFFLLVGFLDLYLMILNWFKFLLFMFFLKNDIIKCVKGMLVGDLYVFL